MLRQDILNKLEKHLKDITKANGYFCNIGENTFLWLSRPLGEKEYPALVIRDSSDNIDDKKYLEHILKIELDIAVSNGEDSIIILRKISSDVLKTIKSFEEDITYRCNYLSSEFLQEQKETTLALARIEFNISYQTPRWEQ